MIHNLILMVYNHFWDYTKFLHIQGKFKLYFHYTTYVFLKCVYLVDFKAQAPTHLAITRRYRFFSGFHQQIGHVLTEAQGPRHYTDKRIFNIKRENQISRRVDPDSYYGQPAPERDVVETFNNLEVSESSV